jgi:heme-degrading monooxygenase HmoA
VFARALEVTTRPGKLREVIRTLQERLMPALSTQPGFVEEFILASDAEPDRVVVLTLWTRHEHAEWFHRRHYGKIRQALEPLLEFEPVIRTFNVENGQSPAVRGNRPPLSARARPA